MSGWRRRRGFGLPCTGLLALMLALTAPAAAEPIRNPVAVFSGLDKITGTITSFEVPVDAARRFGTLEVRARVCNTRPLTEHPKTTAFVEIDEAGSGTGAQRGTQRVFTGWMLAESPGLNALEHPVYDVWLTGCRNPEAPTPSEAAPQAAEPGSGDGVETED